jgi:hypothetical protein
MPLPTVGGSTDTWGTELNAWELVEHNADGTHAAVSLQGSAKLYSGTGVPSAGTGVDGDWYLRKGGAAGSRLYQKVSGAWQAIAETSPAVQDEGIAQGSAGTLNFTGAGVTATVSAGVATVNVPGGGGGGTGQMTATFLVAASDAPAAVIASAQYVCDGTADDVQINAALNALPAGGGRVELSSGTFTIAATVALPNLPVSLVGQGGKATIIKAVSGLTVPLVVVLGPAAPSVYGVNMQRIQYLSIDGSVASGSAAHNLVIAGSVYQGVYEHLHITGAKGHSIYLHSVNTVQTVNIFGSPTGGTFTLTYGAQTTGAIAYNATAGAVQTALRALGLIGTNVTCTGGPLPGTPVTCTFTGVLSGLTGLEVPVLLPTPSLTGGSGPGMFIGAGERPAYNRIAYCNIENGSGDGIRSGSTYPSGLYAEHNEFLHNSITFHTGNGIMSTGNNNRIHSNQLDWLDIGVQLVGCENSAVWGNTYDRCATHWAKIDQGGMHTFAFSLFGDRQAGFSAGSRGFYVTGGTSGNVFIGNHVLKTGDVAGGNGWDYGFDEDSGVGNSGSGYWGPDSYDANAFSFTRNRFNGARPRFSPSNTSSDFTLGYHTSVVHWGSGVPSNIMGQNGDTYHRIDTPGTANQRQYIKSAGAWVALTL